MNARPVDAAEGYALYRELDGAVQLDEINEHLQGIGMRPISRRTYQHYRKLRRHGYRSYVTINRLDIAVAGDAAWSEDMRATYGEIAQPVEATVSYDNETYPIMIERIGPASAAAIGEPTPVAGTAVIVQLTLTGIEKMGTVVRSDRRLHRFHIAFDPYTSIHVAPNDSATHLRVVVPLTETAEHLAAVVDTLLRIQRLVAAGSAPTDDVPRVARVGMGSPLELLLLGGVSLLYVARFARSVLQLRNDKLTGDKLDAEITGLQIDNALKLRRLQAEVSAEIAVDLDAEIDAVETPVLDQIAFDAFPKGDPGSDERIRTIEAAKRAAELPWGTEVPEHGA